MSEVSLKAAHRAYRKHRSSDSVEALCESVVKGQLEHGYTITHVYSFVDVNDTVQLFYCRNGDHEDLLTSPHVRMRALLWASATPHSAPEYLKQAYTELIRREAAEEAAIEARRVGFVAGHTGVAIRQRLEALGSDLRQPRAITFTIEVKYEEAKSVRNTLKDRGFEFTFGAGSPSSGSTLHFKKELPVDEQTISAAADSVAEVATAAGGALQCCSI